MARPSELSNAHPWQHWQFSLAVFLSASSLLLGCTPTSVLTSEIGRAPLYAFCGALGEGCCRPPGSVSSPGVGPVVACDTGLGCDVSTNTCVSPCGGTGQVCCDGPDTRATKWTSDGKLYSPTGPFVRDMCNAGACDPVSHRCFACGNADSQPCCGPDAQQATARCVGENLHCEFTAGSFDTRGICRACGIRGREPCPWGCEDDLGVRNNLCDICGAANQPPCDNGCKAPLGVVHGLCNACGNLNQVPCDSGCRGGLGVRNGLCEACGGANQPPCDNGCKTGTRLIDNICRACGGLNQPPCTSGCNYPLRVAGGVCQQCGALGQIPCDVGCNSGLVIVNNRCQQPTGGPTTCSTQGQTCVADFVSGMHCCQGGGPLLCVYGQCKACVLHGQQCVNNGSQICCDAKDGDICRLDQASGTATCDIPDAPNP